MLDMNASLDEDSETTYFSENRVENNFLDTSMPLQRQRTETLYETDNDHTTASSVQDIFENSDHEQQIIAEHFVDRSAGTVKQWSTLDSSEQSQILSIMGDGWTGNSLEMYVHENKHILPLLAGIVPPHLALPNDTEQKILIRTFVTKHGQVCYGFCVLTLTMMTVA